MCIFLNLLGFVQCFFYFFLFIINVLYNTICVVFHITPFAALQDVFFHCVVFSPFSFHTVVPSSFRPYPYTSVPSSSLSGMLSLLRTLIVVSKIPSEVEWPPEEETWS